MSSILNALEDRPHRAPVILSQSSVNNPSGAARQPPGEGADRDSCGVDRARRRGSRTFRTGPAVKQKFCSTAPRPFGRPPKPADTRGALRCVTLSSEFEHDDSFDRLTESARELKGQRRAGSRFSFCSLRTSASKGAGARRVRSEPAAFATSPMSRCQVDDAARLRCVLQRLSWATSRWFWKKCGGVRWAPRKSC